LELSERNLFLWKRGLLKPLCGIGTFISWLDLRIPNIHEVRIAILWNVINLLGFTPHEAVGRWYVSEIKHGHTSSGENVVFGVFEKVCESDDQLLIVDALHVLLWVELIPELAIVSSIGLID
jgi:hypothetical protein